MLERLIQRRLLFVSGKGGTGKSTFSTLLAQYAAETGKRVLLVEQTGKPILPFFLPKKLNSNIEYVNLGLNNCFEEYVCNYLNQPFLYEKVFNNDSIQTFLRTIPGLAEAMVLGKLYYSLEIEKPSKYDLAIFDCPASGHFFNLIMTPLTIKNSALGGPFMDHMEKIDNFIRSDKVGTVFMTLPEPLVATETVEFIDKVSKEGFHLGCIVKNKWIEGKKKSDLGLDAYPSLKEFLDKDIYKLEESQKVLEPCLSSVGPDYLGELCLHQEASLRPPIEGVSLKSILRKSR